MSSIESGFAPEELRKFTESGRTIAAAVGTSVDLWATAEMGVVLKTWAGRTKVRKNRPLEVSGLMRAAALSRLAAGFASIRGGVDRGEAGVNLGTRGGAFGRVWYRTRNEGRKFQDVYGPGFSKGKHIAPRDWGAVSKLVVHFRAHYAELVRAAKGAAGLSRQAVVQIADSLGIRLESVKGGGALSGAGLAKARRAMPSSGRTYRNGYGIRTSGIFGGTVEAVLVYPLLRKLGMDTTLAGVIRGRLAYFHRNLEEGTFLSASKAAKAYPYLQVLKTAA